MGSLRLLLLNVCRNETQPGGQRALQLAQQAENLCCTEGWEYHSLDLVVREPLGPLGHGAGRCTATSVAATVSRTGGCRCHDKLCEKLQRFRCGPLHKKRLSPLQDNLSSSQLLVGQRSSSGFRLSGSTCRSRAGVNRGLTSFCLRGQD